MDLNAIKKRLNQLQTTNNRTSSLWKPQPGKTQIRIVPYAFNKDNPFIELFFHYNLNNRSYLSPISFGRPDPIEEFAQKLKGSGSKEDYQLSRKLEAKMRTFAPVVVRGEESQGVKFWGFGKTVYQELLSIIADPDYGDITDPVNGRDVVVEFITAEESGASFPKTNIRVKPNQTPISDEPEILERVKSQQDIKEIYQELSYDDLTDVLNEWLNPSEEDSKEEETTESVSASEISSAKSVSNTGDAFDELFNS
ncbi:MAG: hypothetical protein CMC48_10735 [Flavobacteriaceae bacterium]|nr:hypothetical protein [Flavobacteriaceae bacterium]|tara:strand:+ start:95 stop:853 length:759 start_codon:yes stop_codon:yes gene_type:complete